MTNYASGSSQKITSFKQLRVWQKAREFAVYIYKVSKQFPDEEKFGLTSQIRRSAVSVAANIAEGFSRGGQKGKIRFYHMALGSLTEALSHAYICTDLGFINSEELSIIEIEVEDIHKMLNGLIKNAPERSS